MSFQDFSECSTKSDFKNFRKYLAEGKVTLDSSEYALTGMVDVIEEQVPKSYRLQVSNDMNTWVDLSNFLTKKGNLKKQYKHDKLLRDMTKMYGKEYIDHLKEESK